LFGSIVAVKSIVGGFLAESNSDDFVSHPNDRLTCPAGAGNNEIQKPITPATKFLSDFDS